MLFKKVLRRNIIFLIFVFLIFIVYYFIFEESSKYIQSNKLEFIFKNDFSTPFQARFNITKVSNKRLEYYLSNGNTDIPKFHSLCYEFDGMKSQFSDENLLFVPRREVKGFMDNHDHYLLSNNITNSKSNKKVFKFPTGHKLSVLGGVFLVLFHCPHLPSDSFSLSNLLMSNYQEISNQLLLVRSSIDGGLFDLVVDENCDVGGAEVGGVNILEVTISSFLSHLSSQFKDTNHQLTTHPTSTTSTNNRLINSYFREDGENRGGDVVCFEMPIFLQSTISFTTIPINHLIPTNSHLLGPPPLSPYLNEEPKLWDRMREEVGGVCEGLKFESKMSSPFTITILSSAFDSDLFLPPSTTSSLISYLKLKYKYLGVVVNEIREVDVQDISCKELQTLKSSSVYVLPSHPSFSHLFPFFFPSSSSSSSSPSSSLVKGVVEIIPPISSFSSVGESHHSSLYHFVRQSPFLSSLLQIEVMEGLFEDTTYNQHPMWYDPILQFFHLSPSKPRDTGGGGELGFLEKDVLTKIDKLIKSLDIS